jgi:colanic acid biosynthesis protein WcaH
MLDPAIFKTIVRNAPLVSIDLCIICNGQLLLGLRNNNPLKGVWFTPGGRILKNETWTNCLKRIARSELGLVVDDPGQFRLMGIWDHFYDGSVFSDKISTHYVNLPHYVRMKVTPHLKLDGQHNKMAWFDLEEVAGNGIFHEYMRLYSSYLLKMDIKND